MVLGVRAEVHFIIDQALQNMEALEARARATGQTLGTAFNGTEAGLLRYEQALTNVGRNMTIAGAAITGFLGLAVNSAMNFEAQISAVGAVSGAGADELHALSEEALRVGAATTFSATEVGAAAEILAKAGITLENITGDYENGVIGIAEGAVRLSEATGSDITLSAETAAAAMTVFNLTAADTEHVMNTIAQSANASMLGVDDWTTALQYAGPIVATLGYSIDDLAQWMVILGNSGIRGSVAATSLRNILTQLTDAASPASEMLAGYGIALKDVDGNMRGLDQIMTDLVPVWNELDQAEKAQFATQAFGVRGGPAFLNMMNAQAEAVNRGGDAFAEAGKKMEDTGDIYSMSQKRMDNLKGSIERLKGSIETFMIRLGDALTPVIRFAADAINVLTDAMGNLHPTIIAVIAFALAGAAALLVFGGGFLLILPQILMTTTAIARLGGMGGVLRLLVGPIRAIGLAFTTAFWPIALITAAAFLLYQAWKHNFLGLQDLVDNFIGWIKDAWEAVSDFVDGAKEFLGLGDDDTKEVNVDVKTTTDEGFDNYQEIGTGTGKEALVGIKTMPDDMFIEYVYGADGTVIGYNVKITSSLDGTEQTGKIMSSSRDPNNPEEIHMEVQLESGETVNGTYNEITGKFSTVQGNVEVSATFVGDAYTITQVTLPDGTKVWRIIEDETGGTFGDVIQSYTDQTGTTYILIDPDPSSVGDEFWAKADLETGKPEAIVGIDGDPSKFNLTLLSIQSATGDSVPTVMVDIDGNPVPYSTVLSGIMDPATGRKMITIKLANGQTFLLEVDAVTGQIIDSHEITVTADTSEATTAASLLKEQWGEVKEEAGAVQDLLADIWYGRWGEAAGTIFGAIQDLVFFIRDDAIEAFQSFYELAVKLGEGFNAAAEAANNLWDWLTLINGPDEADGAGNALPDDGEVGLGVNTRVERRPTGMTIDKRYDHVDPASMRSPLGTDTSGTYVNESDPYRPTEGGYQSIEELEALAAGMRNMHDAGSLARDTFIGLRGEIEGASPVVQQATIDQNLLASGIQTTDVATMGAATSIGAAGGMIGSTFGTIAGTVVSQSLAAALGAQQNFGLMAPALATPLMTMQADTGAKMGALSSLIGTRAAGAAAAAITSFQGMSTSVGTQFTALQAGATSRISALASAVGSHAATARDTAVTAFSAMNERSNAQMLLMQLSAAMKMRAMATSASEQGESVRSNLVTKLETANSQATSTLARLSGIVAGAGAVAAVSALFAGANIGNSFAAGMESALGRIQAAANAMVAAAMAAVVAKAMISSPSKVFLKYGGYMGEGMELGILGKVKDVRTAAGRLVPGLDLSGGFNTLPAYATNSGAAAIYNTYNQAYVLTSEEWLASQDKISRAQKATETLSTPDGYTQYGRRRR